MGVYTWIREGVKQAVLLGFSDAVEQIGVPIEGQQLNPQLAGFLRQGLPALAEASPAPRHAVGASTSGRKRLG
jgi:hypothetical protein